MRHPVQRNDRSRRQQRSAVRRWRLTIPTWRNLRRPRGWFCRCGGRRIVREFANFLKDGSGRIPEEVYLDRVYVAAALGEESDRVALVRVHVSQRWVERHQEGVRNNADDERTLAVTNIGVAISVQYVLKVSGLTQTCSHMTGQHNRKTNRA